MGFLQDNFISAFLVEAMNFLYTFIQDYSLTIIAVSLAIRLVMVPLDLKQRKNSRMMALIGPEVENLKKRYSNTPEQLNKKTQELYKKNGIRPLAGCLPMLIQLPLLFAFFGAMRVIASEQTVGLILGAANQGAEITVLPQWLWVHNFWQPDSIFEGVMPSAASLLSFVQTNASSISPQMLMMLKNQGILLFSDGMMAVNASVYDGLATGISQANGMVGMANGWLGLPILAGASLFLQQKLTSKTQPQQMNNKMMLYFFPAFSIWICATSNTAFSVYWLTTNVYSLAVHLLSTAYYKRKEGLLQIKT